jgi:hypothetical protein
VAITPGEGGWIPALFRAPWSTRVFADLID